ncbi:synaptotagmin-like protein 3 isoform X2 [Xyrauchen texanus]|uniref:synaptotagmin-like protein 3 isoform X2 n=1 Tax=Xyrauchen texanus TaxID=154827 RepID=UPI00224269E4|nr:synaptotagmin-like protein 3 isoform X2 [Xyrauchen texanus]
MKLEKENWESRQHESYIMDLGLFQALERERVLEVLQRDKALRTIEAGRIRRLRTELQETCRLGAKTLTRLYGQRSCARCQRRLGKFWDCGFVCCGCSHRICNQCRVVRSARDWNCTMCHAYREFKIKSGEWFLEQQAKKFSYENNHETTGDKILQSYQRLSFIAVVPPTPPPFYEAASFNRSQDLKKSKPFTKSMENLMVSVSAHIKKLSKSQSDLSVEADHLTVDHGLAQGKSQSEGAINRAYNLCKAPSLPNLSQNTRDTEQYGSASTVFLTDDDVSYTSAYTDEQRDSNGSMVMDDGNTWVTGEIEIAIAYNNRMSCLEITIKACKNLMFGDMTKKKKCYPYVKVCLLPKKHQNNKMKTTVKRGHNPIYNETFMCAVVREQLVSSVVQASVWHTRGLKRKVFLGETFIHLADWCLEHSGTQRSVWCKLSPKEHPHGGNEELILKAQLNFLPQKSPQTHPHTDDILLGTHGQLIVVITGLPKLHSMSKTAYIEGILCLPGDRELVQRTQALKAAASTLQMNFSRFTHQELWQATLMLNLWEKNSSSPTDCLVRSAQLGGGSSWQRLQQMPGVWHDFVLPLHASVNINMSS